MFDKILILKAYLAVAYALLYDVGHDLHQEYDPEHGHAVSSQTVVRNDGQLPLRHIMAPALYAVPLVHASPLAHYAAPITYSEYENHHEDVAHEPAKYAFGYSVADPHTGDIKSQEEVRDGDVVHGSYSLVQPDGSVRKVEYTADDHDGINAIVHNSEPAVYTEPVYHQNY